MIETGKKSQKAIEKEKESPAHAKLVEKAKGIALELVEQFRKYVDAEEAGETSLIFSRRVQTENAKACAHIVCDRIMSSIEFRWEYKYALYELVKIQVDEIKEDAGWSKQEAK